jgi:hypothetical protein
MQAGFFRGLEIRRVSLEDLVQDPANARTHNERNIDAIAASLRVFGQVEPLVVQRGTRKIIGGNGRLVAMSGLGWTHCDVVEIDVSPTEAAAIGIALNRLAELADWDFDALSAQLKALDAEEIELDALGFSEADYDALIERTHGEEVDNPDGEWKGLPEFNHDDLKPYQTISVHFASAEDVRKFAELTGREIGDTTHYLWFPPQPIRNYGNCI